MLHRQRLNCDLSLLPWEQDEDCSTPRLLLPRRNCTEEQLLTQRQWRTALVPLRGKAPAVRVPSWLEENRAIPQSIPPAPGRFMSLQGTQVLQMFWTLCKFHVPIPQAVWQICTKTTGNLSLHHHSNCFYRHLSFQSLMVCVS